MFEHDLRQWFRAFESATETWRPITVAELARLPKLEAPKAVGNFDKFMLPKFKRGFVEVPDTIRDVIMNQQLEDQT